MLRQHHLAHGILNTFYLAVSIVTTNTGRFVSHVFLLTSMIVAVFSSES